MTYRGPTPEFRLIVLSGPSCVGKSPLDRALARFYPQLRSSLQTIVLYNSRAARPGEVDGVDYHFRQRAQVDALKSEEKYVVMDVRGDLQALDLEDLAMMLGKGDVFFEGNPVVGKILLTHSKLQDIIKISVFMSPLSREEILFFKSPECNTTPADLVTDIMRRKLLRRTRRQKGELSYKDLENIERRAASAYIELKEACHFDYVIANHDGEDSENWDAFYYPLSDARKSLLAFTSLLQGNPTTGVEQWEQGLIP